MICALFTRACVSASKFAFFSMFGHTFSRRSPLLPFALTSAKVIKGYVSVSCFCLNSFFCPLFWSAVKFSDPPYQTAQHLMLSLYIHSAHLFFANRSAHITFLQKMQNIAHTIKKYACSSPFSARLSLFCSKLSACSANTSSAKFLRPFHFLRSRECCISINTLRYSVLQGSCKHFVEEQPHPFL